MRHYFNTRHAGKGNAAWWVWVVVAGGAAVMAWLTTLGPRTSVGDVSGPVPKFAQVEEILISRCSMCHAREPVWATIRSAPAGIELDSADAIRRHARLIARSTVQSSSMPPGNLTEMSIDERRILAAWIAAGAPKN